MHSHLNRLWIAVSVAVLAAGATLVIAQAQDPHPPDPNAPGQPGPKCVSCHTEFASEWQNGPHGQAASDPVFVADWTNQGKPGACLVCHVTGYDPATGTWQEDGVACEACHGAMVPDHPREPMPIDREPELCARCHSDVRFDWQEWQGSTHFQRGMNCATCHDPHSASLKVVTPRDGSAQFTRRLAVVHHVPQGREHEFPVYRASPAGCDLHRLPCQTQRDRSARSAHHPGSFFQANLTSCNVCHADQMHNPAKALGTGEPGQVSSASQPQQSQQAGLNRRTEPRQPLGLRRPGSSHRAGGRYGDGTLARKMVHPDRDAPPWRPG